MFRIKKLFEGTLNLRNPNTQISETYSMIKRLNKLIEPSMPKAKVII